jgi:TolB protein
VALAVLLAWLTWYVLGYRPATVDGAPSWSPDGKLVVFVAERPGARDVSLMNVDGTDIRSLATNDHQNEGAPAFSPDGRQIVYDAVIDGNRDIFVMTAGGQRRVRLTADPAEDKSPAWSPDGRRIVFVSDRAARQTFDLYLMQADGSAVERLTSAGNSGAPQFSPDGGRIAFHSGRDVYVLDLATRAIARLTNEMQLGDGLFPTWAPDGKRIAFTSARNGRMQLFVMDADGRNQQPVLTMPSGSAIEPRWSPADDRILFVHVPDAAPKLDRRSGATRAIYLLDVGSGRVTRLSR